MDEIPCYQFSVKPKKMVKGERYFQGTIWVDDRDFQIVKTYGKGVGITSKDHQFPNFTTYREQIDGKYWFPTYTHADDVLHFPNMSQRIRMVVRYHELQAVRRGGDDHLRRHRARFGSAPERNKACRVLGSEFMPETKITINNNGSIRIEGDFEIVDPQGKAFGLGGRKIDWPLPLRDVAEQAVLRWFASQRISPTRSRPPRTLPAPTSVPVARPLRRRTRAD